jgi:hypothetical protein
MFAYSEVSLAAIWGLHSSNNCACNGNTRTDSVKITVAATETNALIDENRLALVLREGLDPEYKQYKDWMVRYFTWIRNRINVEDLREGYGISSASPERKGCSICKSFANIHCVNCIDSITWLCVDHWRDHGSEHTTTSR